jgi:pimeloyl-ACP methyl ester carboxylesterase
VFVHGNPEVSAIWGPLHDALSGPAPVALSPPGFGAPVPHGFEPTMAGYVAWLVAELDRIAAASGPVDLVGHDWGSGHVLGTVVTRPDLVNTWAVDVLGLCHPAYAWHDAAQGWQQPGVGEAMIETMVSLTVEERVTMFGELGLSPDVGRPIAEGIDADMGRCILGLYRDAAQPAMADLGRRLATATLPPGLAINATDDAYVSSDLTVAVARQLEVGTLDLVGNGHWWMLENPTTAAAALTTFWATHSGDPTG